MIKSDLCNGFSNLQCSMECVIEEREAKRLSNMQCKMRNFNFIGLILKMMDISVSWTIDLLRHKSLIKVELNLMLKGNDSKTCAVEF